MNSVYKESNIESQLKVYMEEKEKMLNSINDMKKKESEKEEKIQALEECLKRLNSEYDQLSVLYGNAIEKNKKSDKIITELRNQNKESKGS